MCGLVGWVTKEKGNYSKEALEYILAQYEDQHTRGQKGFGIICIDDVGQVTVYRATEPLKMLVDLNLNVKGKKHIFLHHRQPTSTENTMDQTHPVVVMNDELKYDWLINHNGVIANAKELYEEHKKIGYEYLTEYQQYRYGTSGDTDLKFNDSESFAIELARYLEGKSKEIKVRGSAAFIAVATTSRGKVVQVVIGTNGNNPLRLADMGYGFAFASEELTGDALEANTGVVFDPVFTKKGNLVCFSRAKKDLKLNFVAPVIPTVVSHTHHGETDEEYYERIYGPRSVPFGFHDRSKETKLLSVAETEHREKVSLVAATLRLNKIVTYDTAELMRKDWRNVDVTGVVKAWSDKDGSYANIDTCKKVYEKWLMTASSEEPVPPSEGFKSYEDIIEFVANGPVGRNLFTESQTNEAIINFDAAKFRKLFVSGDVDGAESVWEEFQNSLPEWLDPKFITDTLEQGVYLGLLGKEPSTADMIDAVPKSISKRMGMIAGDLKPLFRLAGFVEVCLNLGWQHWIKQDITDKKPEETSVPLALPEAKTETKEAEVISESPAPAPAPAPAPTVEASRETFEAMYHFDAIDDAKNEAGAALSSLAEMAETEHPEVIYREAEMVGSLIKDAVTLAVDRQMNEVVQLAAEQGVRIKVPFSFLNIRAELETAERQFKQLADIVGATMQKEDAEAVQGDL